MNSLIQQINETILTPAMDKAGKLTTVCALGANSLAMLGMADVNIVFTVIISTLTAFYMTFKGLNELNKWKRERDEEKAGKK